MDFVMLNTSKSHPPLVVRGGKDGSPDDNHGGRNGSCGGEGGGCGRGGAPVSL